MTSLSVREKKDMNTNITIDEKTYQEEFYYMLFDEEWINIISISRNTDGFTKGILFEHKKNINSYGHAKALGQALIYLARFNRDGIPVPRYTCLVSQEEETCYFYDNNFYLDYINDIESYAQIAASKGISKLDSVIDESLVKILKYDYEEYDTIKTLANYINKIDNHYVKVDINSFNVVGWSKYYYNHCGRGKQKKINFFKELRNPVGILKLLINPWEGQETDFRFIMDMLNDPAEQKKIGAFYTPMEYAEKASELVLKAIQRVPPGNDYVIIDRCAGTGNLEWCLNDAIEDCGEDILSHVIVSSPELKEWEVLKERIGKRVRHLLPNENPKVSENGYLEGANALDKDFLENQIIKQYINNPKCTIILFENPPYAQGSSITNQMEKIGKDACEWKNSYIVKEMKKEVSGTVSNELCNVFIWSAFKYYLRQPTDSYIVFAPPKYWKYHNLVNKKPIDAYGFNRQFFHASASLISCIGWTNIDTKLEQIILHTYDIKDEDNGGGVTYKQDIVLSRMHSIHSERYYDFRRFETDENNGIVVDCDGTEESVYRKKSIKVTAGHKLYNENIIAYMISKGSTLDTPGLNSNLLIATRYDEHGCYLREDTFMNYLPAFAASQFLNNQKSWIFSCYGGSADGADHYWTDINSGKLDNFLLKTLFWCCMTHYTHMRSQIGSDGRLYKNQICFDRGTIASKILAKAQKNGYEFTEQEQELWDNYQKLMVMVKNVEEYNSDFTYGIYQIEQEIDTTYKNKSGKVIHNHGDIYNLVKKIKEQAKLYYVDELVPVLNKYEFIK